VHGIPEVGSGVIRLQIKGLWIGYLGQPPPSRLTDFAFDPRPKRTPFHGGKNMSLLTGCVTAVTLFLQEDLEGSSDALPHSAFLEGPALAHALLTVKNRISDRLFKNDGMQGGRVLRNEAYNQYAAMTMDEAQRCRSPFSSLMILLKCWNRSGLFDGTGSGDSSMSRQPFFGTGIASVG